MIVASDRQLRSLLWGTLHVHGGSTLLYAYGEKLKRRQYGKACLEVTSRGMRSLENTGDAGRARRGRRAGQERTPGGPRGVEEEHIWGLETTARGGHGLGCATSQHLVFVTLQNTQECGFS